MNVFKRFNLLFMKKVFYLLVFLVGTLGNLSAQMVLFKGTFEEAEEKAKEEMHFLACDVEPDEILPLI